MQLKVLSVIPLGWSVSRKNVILRTQRTQRMNYLA